MTTLIFSTGGAPRTLFISLKVVPGTLFSWPVTENPSREVATKDHSSSNPRKGNPPNLKTKVDVSKVDVKGFPKQQASTPHEPCVRNEKKAAQRESFRAGHPDRRPGVIR